MTHTHELPEALEFILWLECISNKPFHLLDEYEIIAKSHVDAFISTPSLFGDLTNKTSKDIMDLISSLGLNRDNVLRMKLLHARYTFEKGIGIWPPKLPKEI